MALSKKEVLESFEEVNVDEIENVKEEKKFEIKNRNTGDVLFSSSKKTIKDVLEEAVKEGADLKGAELEGANLKGAKLEGANLRNADLKGADLGGADLKGADLKGVDLKGADLKGADLRYADLRGADFYETKFYGKGGKTKIKADQLDDFLIALGVVVD